MRSETGDASRDAGSPPAPASCDRLPLAGTVADFTEQELIARIQAHLPPAPSWMLVGIGDDAAVVEPERNRLEVLSVDALVEGIHFDRLFTPPGAIGHRALAVNLSDLAAMGAAPRLALLSFALPAALPAAEFDAIVGGLAALASRHGVHVAGGNLTRSPGPLVIDITVTGSVKRRRALTRRGARAGDEIYVSGVIGSAAAGLGILRAAAVVSLQSSVVSRRSSVGSHESSVGSRESSVVSRESSVGRRESSVGRHDQRTDLAEDLGLSADDRRLARSYLFPSPRVRMGVRLSRNRAAVACIDLSDGLADAVRRIACAGGVGAIIDAEALPIDPAARRWFDAQGTDPVTAAIAGGDDYELLIAVRPRLRRRLAAIAGTGAALTRIGTFTADRALLVRRRTGEVIDDRALPAGYGHFR